MKEELKPCPFCGTAAHFFKIQDMDSREWGGEGICCQTEGCAQVGLMWSTMDDCRPSLAEIWNRRASPSAGQWIAVTERLPEPDEEVLGYCTFGSIYACFYRHGEWHDGAWSYPKITHWMPLPAPPLSDIKGEK